MDLHFTGATPTAEENAAIDGVALTANGSKRTYLLPVLHAIQDRVGWISSGALNYASRMTGCPSGRSFWSGGFLRASFHPAQPPVVAHVCDDIACKIKGADQLCAEMERMRTGPRDRARMETPPGIAALAWACASVRRPPWCMALESESLRAGLGAGKRTRDCERLAGRTALTSMRCGLPSRRWASPD